MSRHLPTFRDAEALPVGLASKRAGTLRVGGRLVYLEGRKGILADAAGELRFTLAKASPEVSEGQWVTASGQLKEQTLADAIITPCHPGKPGPESDWFWFQQRGRHRAGLLQQRSALRSAIRRFFEEAGFTEVETPHWVESPGIEAFVDALPLSREVGGGYLHTSPEYHMKRLLSAGFPRIYQLCRCFRRAEVGTLHQPEFTMAEWYRSFANYHDMMEDTEALVEAARGALRPLEKATSPEVDWSSPWPRMTVAEAFRLYAQADANALSAKAEHFYEVMATQVQPKLGLAAPVFLIDWPAPMASLAKRKSGEPAVAERFEAYLQGVELCNGFTELTDPAEQRKRLEDASVERAEAMKSPYPIDERFLGALEAGMPPSAGNALGVDRLLMLLTGTTHIQDVTAFDAARR